MRYIILVLILLSAFSCSKENVDSEIPNKHVSFLMIAPSNEFEMFDYYEGILQASYTRTNIDSCWVELNMKYGTHKLVISLDGNQGVVDFLVNDSTKETYKIRADVPASGSLKFNTSWGDPVYYEF